MDHSHPPIKVAYQDTIILSYLHYGESTLVVQLRWLPYIELAVAALFILIGYISFSYIKRSEQSNIWVGMARETAHQLRHTDIQYARLGRTAERTICR